MAKKKLKRSSNVMIAGVASGVAEYFNIDPTIVRIVWATSVLLGGLGVFLYLICWLIMPKE